MLHIYIAGRLQCVKRLANDTEFYFFSQQTISWQFQFRHFHFCEKRALALRQFRLNTCISEKVELAITYWQEGRIEDFVDDCTAPSVMQCRPHR